MYEDPTLTDRQCDDLLEKCRLCPFTVDKTRCPAEVIANAPEPCRRIEVMHKAVPAQIEQLHRDGRLLCRVKHPDFDFPLLAYGCEQSISDVCSRRRLFKYS